MNRLFRILIIASTLTIPFMSSPQAHAELRSPCVLTQSEEAMVAKLTRMRNHLRPDDIKIKECLTFASHTILIRYEGGYVGLFGIGEGTTLDQKQKIPVAHEITNEPPEISMPHTGTNHERKIFTELDQIWRSTDLPDDLSPEQLARTDALVKELFAATSADEIQLATYNSLGLRGNRYLGIIKETDSLPPDALIPFYEGYLNNSAIHSRTEDMPTDNDEQIALEKLVNIFEMTEPDKIYSLPFDISQKIKKINLDSYASLKELGMITEEIE